MCKRSPSVNYVYKKVRTTKKSVLQAQLREIPLTTMEFNFINDVIAGLSIMELADKYNKSPSRTSQVNREICEKIHAFDIAIFKH